MESIASFFKGAGITVLIITGIWGFFLCLGIISDAAGFWGLVVSLFLAPITFFAAPLYAGFEYGNWFPLALNYGGGIAAMILMFIGGIISGK